MENKNIIIIITKSGIELEINPDLDQYAGKVMFPKKLAKANAILKKVGLPKQVLKKN